MKKPEKRHVSEPVYHYNEVIDYIEDKYGIQTRGYKRELDGEYRDFWHWMIDHNSGVHNGSYISIPEDWECDICDEDGSNPEPYAPWWVREIIELIVKEFFPNGEYMEFWASW